MPFEYSCPKCGFTGYLLAEMRGSSGGLTAYFNVDTQIVTLLTCGACRYAEVYLTTMESFKLSHGITGDYYPEADHGTSPLGPVWKCACGNTNDSTLDACASCNAPRRPVKVVSIDITDEEWECACGHVNEPSAAQCAACGELRQPTARDYFRP